jgi:hypothetical protein
MVVLELCNEVSQLPEPTTDGKNVIRSSADEPISHLFQLAQSQIYRLMERNYNQNVFLKFTLASSTSSHFQRRLCGSP